MAEDDKDKKSSPGFARRIFQGTEEMLKNLPTKNIKQIFPFSKDDEYFRSLFKQLPAEERRIDDFLCALQKDILIQGRIFVSQNYLSFYSNIFGWETMLYISCKDIVEIKKEKTAFVIPNAIQIITKQGKYTFSSFISRDLSFRCFNKVWANAVALEPLSFEQLCEYVDKQWEDGTSLKASDTESADFESPAADTPLDKDPPREGTAPSKDPLPEKSSLQGEGSVPTSPRMSLASEGPLPSSSSLAQPLQCPCPSHTGKLYIDIVLPCAVDVLYKLLFTDSNFMRELYRRRKTTNFTCESWLPVSGALTRNLNYEMPVNKTFGPKTAQANETQVEVFPHVQGEMYIIDAEVRTPNVPYGDNFYTVSRYCLTFYSATEARLKVVSDIRYRKGAPWHVTKTFIEKYSHEGLKLYWEQLTASLLEYVSNPDNSALFEEENEVTIAEDIPAVGESSTSEQKAAPALPEEAAPHPSRDASLAEILTLLKFVVIPLLVAILFALLVLIFSSNPSSTTHGDL